MEAFSFQTWTPSGNEMCGNFVELLKPPKPPLQNAIVKNVLLLSFCILFDCYCYASRFGPSKNENNSEKSYSSNLINHNIFSHIKTSSIASRANFGLLMETRWQSQESTMTSPWRSTKSSTSIGDHVWKMKHTTSQFASRRSFRKQLDVDFPGISGVTKTGSLAKRIKTSENLNRSIVHLSMKMLTA